MRLSIVLSRIFLLLVLIGTLGAPMSSGAEAVPADPVQGGLTGFLLSPRGRKYLKTSSHPLMQALRRRLGESETTPTALPPPADIDLAGPLTAPGEAAGCGSPSGSRFNLEPRTPPAALPQNGTSIDFLPAAGLGGADLVVGAASDFRGFFGGLGNSASGYYVHRNGASANPCGADFEGGLPPLQDRLTGQVLLGSGDPQMEADPARNAFYIADARQGAVSAVGLFRSTAVTLNDTTACPNGTHPLPAAQTCWPARIEVNPFANGDINVKPHIAVDPRALGSGPGAGDVYVTVTISKPMGSSIGLTACNNGLTACSTPVVISGIDNSVQFPHVRVRPDVAVNPSGAVTVTYVNILRPGSQQIFDIKYVTCTPQGAPNPPSCAPPKLIVSETQPVPMTGGGLGGGSLAATQFLIGTYPKHEHRMDANGVETYVVWDRCKVPDTFGGDICPNADIAMAASGNNGATWSFAAVDAGAGDQYLPWIRTDSANTLNIIYYSTQADNANHRAQVILRQIPPGAATPDPPGPAQVLVSLPIEPAGDFFLAGTFIGTNIGVAARSTPSGRRGYVHFMHNAVSGIYNGQPAPEQNNHLVRYDY